MYWLFKSDIQRYCHWIFHMKKNPKKATQDKSIIRKLDGNTAVDLRNIKQTGRNKYKFSSCPFKCYKKKSFFLLLLK